MIQLLAFRSLHNVENRVTKYWVSPTSLDLIFLKLRRRVAEFRRLSNLQIKRRT